MSAVTPDDREKAAEAYRASTGWDMAEGAAVVEAFLAALTPSRVLRDRERKFTPAERKRQAFLRQKAHIEALRRQERKETA